MTTRAIATLFALLGCQIGEKDDGDTAGTGDGDADTDTDGDGDTDSDGDSDADGDGDSDADSDSDADGDPYDGTWSGEFKLDASGTQGGRGSWSDRCEGTFDLTIDESDGTGLALCSFSDIGATIFGDLAISLVIEVEDDGSLDGHLDSIPWSGHIEGTATTGGSLEATFEDTFSAGGEVSYTGTMDGTRE